MTTFYENDIESIAGVLNFLPPEVQAAIQTIAHFQHETNIEIKFGWMPYRPGEKYAEVKHAMPWVTIENAPRRFVMRQVKKECRRKSGYSSSKYPEIFFETNLAGNPCHLHIKGDAEQNIKDAIELAASYKEKEYVKSLAESLVSQAARHPLGAADFTATPDAELE